MLFRRNDPIEREGKQISVEQQLSFIKIATAAEGCYQRK